MVKIYTVHQPAVPAGDSVDQADELIFVRDGFSWLALLLPPIWLIMNRVWIGLALFFGFTIIVNVIILAAGLNPIFATLASVLISLVIAFEGHNLRRWHLDQADYKLIGSVTGKDLNECELKFFESWTLKKKSQVTKGTENFIPGSPVASTNLGTSPFKENIR